MPVAGSPVSRLREASHLLEGGREGERGKQRENISGSEACQRNDKNMMYFSLRNLLALHTKSVCAGKQPLIWADVAHELLLIFRMSIQLFANSFLQAEGTGARLCVIGETTMT